MFFGIRQKKIFYECHEINVRNSDNYEYNSDDVNSCLTCGMADYKCLCECKICDGLLSGEYHIDCYPCFCENPLKYFGDAVMKFLMFAKQ